SLPDRHRARVPAPRIPPRREGPAQPLLRPVSARVRGAREHTAPATRVPPAHLRGHGVREPLAPLPAAPDPPLHGTLYRPDFSRAVRRGCGERGPVPPRARGRCFPRPE